MKESEYLNELRESLEGKLSPELIRDVISDYESFFASGKEEGKTDDEISVSLGSPAFLAKSLLEGQEEKAKKTSPDQHYADPGRRIFAFLLDAVIAIFPAFVVTLFLGNAFLSYILLMTYPSPLIGVVSSFSVAAYQETKVHEYSVISTQQPFETNGELRNSAAQGKSLSKQVVLMKEEIYGNGAQNGADQNGRPSTLSIVFAALSLSFYLFYSFIATLIWKGQTMGKKLAGIKVCSLNGGSVEWKHSLYRELFGKILMNSIPIFPVISFFTILLTKEHRALHDMLSDTVVFVVV